MATKKSRIRSNPAKEATTAKKKGHARQPKHDQATTDRPESPELEGLASLPEELTGLATRTDENLTALFDNPSPKHITDGFHGGSGDDEPTLDATDGPGDIDDED